jgi:hypothetical protein
MIDGVDVDRSSGKIAILGNCDIGPITSALSQLLPRYTIKHLMLKNYRDLQDCISSNLSDNDLIFVNSTHLRGGAPVAPNPNVIVYPRIYFNAFHPDSVYIWKDKNILMPNYHSGIATACYMRGLSVKQAVGLFNRSSYEKPGYMDAWDESFNKLKREFELLEFDFDFFFKRVKRSGVFMHSQNHPTRATFVALAMLLAIRAGAPATIIEQSVVISDALALSNWPIYPEIGEIYASAGAYLWRSDLGYMGLEEYVASEFKLFKDMGLTSDSMRLAAPASMSRLNALLESC